MGTTEAAQTGVRQSVLNKFIVDRQGIELALLFLVVVSATAMLALPLHGEATTSTPEAFGEGSSGDAAFGAAFAAVEVAFAVGILALALVWRRIPEWIRDLIADNVEIAVLVFAGAVSQPSGQALEVALFIIVLYSAYEVLDHYSIYWMLNNLFGIGLAIYGGLVIGQVFGVWGIAALLLLLTIYDHAFANKQTWMFTLGETVLKLRLPLVFFRPDRLELSWEEILEGFDEAEEDPEPRENSPIGWGIGTADLLLPAGFVAAVVIEPGQFGLLAAVAVIAGIVVACFRLRFEMLTRGSGAGLPALCAGALIPYVALVGLGTVV